MFKIQKIIENAKHNFLKNDLNRAEELCLYALKLNANEQTAQEILGLIYSSRNQHNESIPYFKKALKNNANSSSLHYYLARSLMLSHQYPEAIDHFQKSFFLDNKSIDALINQSICEFNLNNYEKVIQTSDLILKINEKSIDALNIKYQAYYKLEKLNDAIDILKSIIYFYPKIVDTYFNLASILFQIKRFDETLKVYEFVKTNFSHTPEIFFNIGLVLHQLLRYEDAVKNFEHAIKLNPKVPYLYFNKGLALQALYRFKDASEAYSKAIEISPNYLDAYVNRGLTYSQLQLYSDALDDYDQAIKLDCNNPIAFYNKALVFNEIGNLNESLSNYDNAYQLNCKSNRLHPLISDQILLNRSLAHLKNGNFSEGWTGFECRKKLNFFISSKPYHNLPELKLNDCNSFNSHKKILVYCEQGLGDSIQFCRFIPSLFNFFEEIFFAVPESLFSLMKSLDKRIKLIKIGEDVQNMDYQIALMSLPHLLNINDPNFFYTKPYLTADSRKVFYWQEKLNNISKKPRIGLVWNGGFRKDEPWNWIVNQRRNVSFHLFAEFLDIRAIDFFSLQKGEPAESELKSYMVNNSFDNFYDFSDELIDFSDTAAFVFNLDLIISVDTSTAHLASALGKNTWMLNRFDSCWRWLNNREDSPWYSTLKLFNQKVPGEWISVINACKSEIKTTFIK